MYADMRKRVNSSEAEPLVTENSKTVKNEHFSIDTNSHDSHHDPASASSQLKSFLLNTQSYSKREICKAVTGLFLAIIFLVSAAGLIMAKTGVAYKIKGKTKILSPHELAAGDYKIPNISKEESFAIVINTYKRPDMLKSALNHWVNTCGLESSISQVFVVWAELEVTPPKPEEILPEYKSQLRKKKSIFKKTEFSTPTIEFVRVPKDSLNSRFLPIKNLKTDAVFMIDDDVRIDCQSLKSSFEAWRYYPDTLVGFYPRLASPKSGWFRSKADMIYHTWPIVYTHQKFNIILTKASFFHKKYLKMYHDDDENPSEILNYIDANKNCEDIAMAFLIARKTGKPKEIKDGYCSECPLYTKGKIQDEGLFNGISTSGGSLAPQGHMEKRSMCLDEITRIYKKRGWEYPLFDVNLGEQSWRHISWWLNMPSNIFEWFSVGNTLM